MALLFLPKEILLGKLSGKFISLPQFFFVLLIFFIAITTQTYTVPMDTQAKEQL